MCSQHQAAARFWRAGSSGSAAAERHHRLNPSQQGGSGALIPHEHGSSDHSLAALLMRGVSCTWSCRCLLLSRRWQGR